MVVQIHPTPNLSPILHGLLPTGMWGLNLSIIVNSDEVGANNLVNLKVKTMNKKHYLVYKTTNLVNGKIYIGKHETDNLDDGYLGSGKLLIRAIKKYGEENFKREILFECSSKEEMDAKEAELVNEDFLKRKDVYNIKLGGDGGWNYINSTGINNSGDNAGKGGRRNSQMLKNDEQHKKNFSAKISRGLRKVWKEHPEKFDNFIHSLSFLGRHHTEESKAKMREMYKKFHYQSGERNSQFGTKCIYNETLRKTKHVKPEDVQMYLDEGWKLGAVYNWEAYFKRNPQKE